jgi:hypothetical protein
VPQQPRATCRSKQPPCVGWLTSSAATLVQASHAMKLLAPLLLLGAAGIRAEDDTSDCVAGGTIENPTPPESLVEHRATIAKDTLSERTAAFTSEDMVAAREARQAVRTYFEERTSMDAAGAEIALSPRFCGLDYPECEATFGNGVSKPAGLECANVVPLLNQNCSSTEMTEYGIAIGLPSAFWIAFGITFMVLYAIWYLLRCCKLFGGRLAGKGLCCMKCVRSCLPARLSACRLRWRLLICTPPDAGITMRRRLRQATRTTASRRNMCWSQPV